MPYLQVVLGIHGILDLRTKHITCKQPDSHEFYIATRWTLCIDNPFAKIPCTCINDQIFTVRLRVSSLQMYFHNNMGIWNLNEANNGCGTPNALDWLFGAFHMFQTYGKIISGIDRATVNA